jgi:Eukaryotic aspartyl protease
MQIQIGSTNTEFTLMLDTQTIGIWVPADNCTTGGCLGMKTLVSTSLAPVNPPATWNLNYPTNGSVEGRSFMDSMTIIAGLPSQTIHFGLADTVSSGFNGNVRPLSGRLI